jgi:hypothetical protein
MSVASARTRPRPVRAINARQRDSAAKLAAVTKALKVLGRSGVPITRTHVAQLAGVSRSFTYENEHARTMITAAQTRSQAHANEHIAAISDQQEASWRERALNAEHHARELRAELITQRRLVSDLTGQLREADGTWIQHDRDRLRRENDTLLLERNQLILECAERQRKLDGARANVSRLNEQRVTMLFPNGPGPTSPADATCKAPVLTRGP